jgi:predicted dehydrogenase
VLRPLGWGVVGTGDVSRYLVSDLGALDSARRAAVCSRSPERGREFAAEFGFDVAHASMADFLADVTVDIVYLATPHSTHADLAVRALEAGKHVLVEKPLGIDAAEVARVAATARANERFAMEGMWMKFNPVYRALLDDVRDGGIGELGSVRASFGLPFGAADSPRWSAELASSTLLDQGIYPVTLARDLWGVPDSLRASARTRADGVDLTIEATLRWADGRFAQIAASMVGYVEPTASVNGTSGWIDVPAPFWATDRYTRHAGSIGEALMNPQTIEFPRAGFGYTPMLQAVMDAVGSGLTEHPLHTLDDSLAVARILDDIRSAATADIPTLENSR